jgi:hypothetical protein
MYDNTNQFKEWLRESHYHFKDTKAFHKKGRNYHNGDQLDYWTKLILANRRQPEQHENNIAKHNNAILGFKADRETEIQVIGMQQRDKATANLHNAILKAIRENANYQEEVDSSDSHLSIEGVSVLELNVIGSGDFDQFNREHKEITFRELDPDNCYFDPYSKALDYNKDGRYFAEAYWVDKEVLYRFADKDVVDGLSVNNFISDVHNDDLTIVNQNRKRCLVVYMWYKKYDTESKKDKIYFSFWSGNTILVQAENPFIFDSFPFEFTFLNRDFDAKIKYWGLYRDVMPLQDNINYAKLRLFNMIGTSKTLVQRGAIQDDDIDLFAAEFALDSATVLVEDINGIKDVKMQRQIQQLLNVIIDSRNQINEILGVNKEMLGTANNRMSAVGQERRIETGLVGLSKFLKACETRDKRVAKKTIKLVEQYYDSERVISIIDEDFAQEYLIINQTVQNEYGGVSYDLTEDGKLVPISQNKIIAGKYDLIYTNKLKSTSINSERLRANVELVKILQSTNPDLVQYIVPEILKDSDSPSADKIRRIVYQKEQERQNSPETAAQNQADEATRQMDMAYKNSMINLNNAKARAMMNKNDIDLQKAYSSAVIAKENIVNKQQQAMLKAGKGA